MVTKDQREQIREYLLENAATRRELFSDIRHTAENETEFVLANADDDQLRSVLEEMAEPFDDLYLETAAPPDPDPDDDDCDYR